RTDLHKTPDGDLVPSRNADADELLGIGSALGAVGRGAFGMNSDFDDEAYELAWLKRLARETKRPVWFLLTDRYDDPGRWRRLMKAVHEARAEGPADDRADRRPADRRHDGHWYRTESVHGEADLQTTRKLTYRRAADASARPKCPAPNPRRAAVRRRSGETCQVPPGRHQQLGQVLRHGRSAGLRAAT